MSYKIQRKSNYEGFKAIDRLLEKIDAGILKPPGSDNKSQHWCDLCKCWKRSQEIVPSMVMGRPASMLGLETKTRFRGRFVVCCAECARDLRMARVA